MVGVEAIQLQQLQLGNHPHLRLGRDMQLRQVRLDARVPSVGPMQHRQVPLGGLLRLTLRPVLLIEGAILATHR